jgi:phage gpG-like protein
MAGVSLTVTDDLGRIVSRLETAIAGVDDFRPMWRRLAPAWEARGREMFRTQGRSTGSPWPQYEDTAEREFYQWYKAGILRRDVTQLRPLTWTPGREVLRPSFESVRHPAAVYDARRRTLEVGSAVPYAGDHNAGRGRAPERMGGHAIPRRPLLRFDRPFVLAVAEASREHALTAERTIDPSAKAAPGGRGIGLTSRDVNALLGAA